VPEQLFLIGMFVAMCSGGVITAGVLLYYRFRRAARDAAAWVHVGNMNTLLRLDLDHLTGNDDNHALRELRAAFKELSAQRPPGERKLFEHYNSLVGVAIAFGLKVRDDDDIVHMQAVANRRAHVQNALAVGDQIEAALGGIGELARCGQPDRRERQRQIYQRA
jgi:hypothetical protein